MTSLAQGWALSLDILEAWPSKRRNPTSSRRSAPSVKNRFHGEKSGKRIGQKFDIARRGAEISEEKTEFNGTVCSALAYESEVVPILARNSGIVLICDLGKSVKSHEEDLCFARTFRKYYGSSS